MLASSKIFVKNILTDCTNHKLFGGLHMNKENTFEQQLFSITTIINSEITLDGTKYNSQGSGFYYVEETPSDKDKTGPQWYKLDKFWLVTNRHVVLFNMAGKEYLPDSFTFCFRKKVNDEIQWFPISLTKSELSNILKLHKNSNVDVALLDISQYVKNIMNDYLQAEQKPHIYLPLALSNQNLPENQPLTIDVTSDIIVSSYPQGFYDVYNKFPIVKSGIIASGWGLEFNKKPMFQIDAQLFPGSSGGLVISKPTNIALINGKVHYATTKQFVFLGIYSGEYIWKEKIQIDEKEVELDRSYGLGSVWYSYLVPQIIGDGIKYE